MLNDALNRVGDQRPRLRSVPVAVSSAGTEAIRLAERAGLVLDDWEQWVLAGALGERADGKWSAKEIGLICPRQNGKSAILEAREIAGLFLFGERLILHTSHEFKTSRKAYKRLRDIIEGCPALDAEVLRMRDSHGEEGIELRNGAELDYVARSGGSARGFTADLVVYDEAMILDAEPVGASLPTMSARQHVTAGGPQVWYTASAGLGVKSTQLALVRRRGIAGNDPTLFYAEWSIEPHDDYCTRDCDQHDDAESLDALFKSNPGLGLIHSNGTGLTLEAVEFERRGMSEIEFRRERLGIGTYPAPADGWAVIPRRWWELTTVSNPHRPSGVCFGVDTTPGREMSAIAVAGTLDSSGAGYVELVDHRPGTSWVLGRARELDRRWGPGVIFVIDPRAAAGSLIDDFESSDLTVERLNAQQTAQAFGQFYDDVRDNKLSHADDRELTKALAGAATRKLGDGQAWDRQHIAVDICPLVAYTFAWWGWRQHATDEYDAGDSVHFNLAEIERLCRLGAYGPADLLRLHQSGLLDDDGLTYLASQGIRV